MVDANKRHLRISWTERCRNCNGLNDLCWAQLIQTQAPCLSLEPQVGEQRIIPSDDLVLKSVVR